MQEIWKNIGGYSGNYQISNIGNVRSKKRNNYFKILKLESCRLGYKRIMLYKNKIPGRFLVHRLVAAAFIPNYSDLPQINHIDGDKANNNIDNLEWVTSQQNVQHAINTKLRVTSKGIKHYKSLFDKNSIQKIRYDYNNGIPLIQLSKKYKVASSVIFNIVNFKTYKDV